jgi:hypothetical protein
VISFDMAIAKRSRPTKLQPETKKRLLDAIATGAHLETACTSVGICYQTMREWIARGEGRDPERPKAREFAEFAEEIQQALAKAELRLVELVSQSAFDDPRQANWILERRYPHHWSKRKPSLFFRVGCHRLHLLRYSQPSRLTAIVKN